MSENEKAANVDPTRTRLLIIVACVLAVVAAGGAAFWKSHHPNFDKYAVALDAMKNHKITVDGSGRVDFSKQFPGLTDQDQALVTWLPDGNFRAMFPTYHGRGAEIAGLMYTSRRLTADDTANRNNAIHFDQLVIGVGSYDWLVIDEKFNDHWYRVSFKIH